MCVHSVEVNGIPSFQPKNLAATCLSRNNVLETYLVKKKKFQCYLSKVLEISNEYPKIATDKYSSTYMAQYQHKYVRTYDLLVPLVFAKHLKHTCIWFTVA